jgi:hypothetical protein
MVGAAATIGVALIAALVIAHNGSPPRPTGHHPTGPPTKAELHYLQSAYRKVRNSPACRHGGRAVSPATSDGTPGQALLSAIGALRRPSTPRDAWPRQNRGAITGEAGSVYVRYIRLAQVTGGFSYYIIPVSSVLSGGGAGPMTARCTQATRRSLNNELPQIPRRLRPAVLALMARAADQERKLREEISEPGVCMAWIGAARGGGQGVSCGATAGQLKQWGLLADFAAAGIVPDGVARVTLRYPASGGLPAQSATVKVVGNVFVSGLRVRRPNQGRPTLIWRSADGRIIKTLSGSQTGHARATHGACGGSSCSGASMS